MLKHSEGIPRSNVLQHNPAVVPSEKWLAWASSINAQNRGRGQEETNKETHTLKHRIG